MIPGLYTGTNEHTNTHAFTHMTTGFPFVHETPEWTRVMTQPSYGDY